MASYRSRFSVGNTGVINGQNLNITKPTGTADGDLLVAVVQMSNGGGGTLIGAPAGWTQFTQALSTATYGRYAIFYRIASGEGASYNFPITTAGGSENCAGLIHCYTGGVNTSTPLADLTTQANQTASPPWESPTYTPTASGISMAVVLCPTNGNPTFSAVGNGYTLRFPGGSENSASMGSADKATTSGVATGVVDFTAGFLNNNLGVQFTIVPNAAPTIAYGASSLTDGTTTHNATPTLTAYVTDADTGQTETVTFEVATDSGFTSIVYSGTATTASPSASAAVSKVVGVTLVKDTTYYWRARVSDGIATSANTTARTFYVNRTPTAADPGTNPSGFVAVGTGSQTIAWTYADADGDAQTKYYLRRVINGVTTYWTGTVWGATEVAVTSAAASVSVPFAADTHQYVVSVAVEDGSAAKSAYTQVASFTIYTPPTLSIGASTPAAVVSTGGPTLSLGWTYAQAEGYAQATYRVQVQNAAGSVTYYDSGVLSGTAASVAIDAVANGIPTDTTTSALKVIVTVTSATIGTSVSANKAFDIQWGVVTCSITNPTAGEILAASSVTATWSFASTRGFIQSKYRVRLMLNSTGAVLYDSGFVTSTAATLAIPATLVDGTYYSLEVTLQNAMGVTN